VKYNTGKKRLRTGSPVKYNTGEQRFTYKKSGEI
jgi:hypothetical protein